MPVQDILAVIGAIEKSDVILIDLPLCFLAFLPLPESQAEILFGTEHERLRCYDDMGLLNPTAW